MNNSQLVYSTDSGRICPKCRKSSSKCTCNHKWTNTGPQPRPKSDGSIRIRSETKVRKGKTVTTLLGFDLDDHSLRNLAKDLKQHCGTGGSVKDGMIVIQGDHRDKVKRLLAGQGYRGKLAGG